MNILLVNGQPVSESRYKSVDGYEQIVLKSWHDSKVKIQCGCQVYAEKADMHVRKSQKGFYTIANNPGNSDKHTAACPFYGEEERAAVKVLQRPPVEQDGNRTIIHVRLFSDRREGETGEEWLNSTELHTPQEHTRTNHQISEEQSRQMHFTFNDFVYRWYQEAVRQTRREKKKLSKMTVLYYMWKLMIEHRLWIGSEDFQRVGIIPNRSLKQFWGKRVLVGYVRQTSKYRGSGEVWEIEGIGGSPISVLIREQHLPSYPVEGKMAALRIDFNKSKFGPPPSISPAKAWHITEEGWWLHSEAEWQALHLLRDRGFDVKRPAYPSVEWFGYQPDFVTLKDNRLVFLDVMEEPYEELTQNLHRKKQEEVFRAADREKVITYIPWKAGDVLDI